LPAEFQSHDAGIPWADIIAMRNFLVHHYFGIDENAVWAVVAHDLLELKLNVQVILADLDKFAT